jgi:hypothetical protein
MRIISKERAYALASQWGSFIHDSDPGACLYALYPDDGRPLSDEHRVQCLQHLRRQQTKTSRDREYRELMQLIRFMANTPLRRKDQEAANA